MLAVGTVAGWWSLNGLGKCMWGSAACSAPTVFLIVFLCSATAFISGGLLSIGIAVRSIFSSSDLLASGIAPVPKVSSDSRMLLVALIASVSFTCLDVLEFNGGPPFFLPFGPLLNPHHRWSAILGLVLSQAPFVVVLMRIRRGLQPAAFALAICAGTLEFLTSLSAFSSFLNLPQHFHARWEHGLFGTAVVVFSFMLWSASGWRKKDALLVISVAFGFLTYTVLWIIGIAFLTAHERLA